MPKRKISQHDVMQPDKGFTLRQEIFINEYVRTGNKSQAGEVAGYKPSTVNVLMRKPEILNEIQLRVEASKEDSIATGTDAMIFLTRVMNGEIKDQFDLDATLRDRLDACKEILKRTKDIELKAQERKEQANNEFHLSIDWTRRDNNIDELNEISNDEVVIENE